MAEIHLNQDNFHKYTERSRDGVPFIVLGKALPDSPAASSRARAGRLKKIRRQTRAERADVWGTLGMDNVAGLNWSGILRFSEAGNDRSEPETSMPVTCEQIDLIRQTHPEATTGELRVRERYISFEQIQFGDLPANLTDAGMPRLRLTVMLRPDEGALVYYQLYPNLQSVASANARKEVDIEYIQPKPTESHRCDTRDRLDYSIPLLTRHPIEETDDGTLRRSEATIHERFVIKILTFRRRNAETRNLLQRLHYHIWGHTHELLRWDPSRAAFFVVDGSALSRDARTLFLIHGTASATDVAFSGLLEGGASSWVARQHAANGGRYGQIIGFNHPTFSEDAHTNATAFLDRLPRGFEFDGGTDVITHSRGGLLGKYFALHHCSLHIERGALVTCANGVGYFVAARRIAKLLSILRATTSSAPMLQWLLALAQHSGEAILELPGSRLMTPGSDELTDVLREPSGPNIPTFLPVVGDFSKEMVAHNRLLRRWAERGLDLLIKTMLGSQHDWVVGTREQYIVAPKCYPKGWSASTLAPSRIHACRHSDYFDGPENGAPNPIPGRIDVFLRSGKAW